MLVVRTIGIGQAGYYLDGRTAGTWSGTGCAALGLSGPVDRATLVAALSGCDPNGHVLLPRRSTFHRAGFDLIFGASKSVSLLAALSDGLGRPAEANAGPAPGPEAVSDGVPRRSEVVEAHDAAVRDTLAYIERRAAWTRRGATGRRIPVSGLVAVGFRHGFSWSGDPHLHTHLLVANLVRGADGIWSCLDSRSLYNHRRAASALYQASLRHHLARAGLRLRWSVRADGLGDVVGVPRAAIEACSTRRQAVLAVSAGVTPPTMAARAAAAGLTRRLGAPSTKSWEQRAADGGLDRRLSAELLARWGVDRPPERMIPEGLGALVEDRLSSSMSTFGHADCVRLAAALLDDGAPATAIEQWADDFLSRSIPVSDRAWVTPIIRRREDQLAALVAPRSAKAGLARPVSVARSLADRPGLGATARQAVETLTSSGAVVERLGYRPFLAQAAVLEAAHAAWVASGHRVSVIASTPRSMDRWTALCGLREQAQFPRLGSVVVVDNADRLCTAELHGIIANGTSRLAKVILVEGGTGPAPSQHVGPAFNRLRALLPAVDPGTTVATFGQSAPVRGGFDQTVAVASTSQEAFNALVEDWANLRAGGQRAVMVAPGAEEAEGLNSLARQLLAGRGGLRGPGVAVDGRQWREGDELRVLRRHPLFGRAAAGTLGVVTGVDPATGTVTTRWPAGSMTVAATDLRRAPATYAYATTPAYLRYWDRGQVLCLGDLGGRQLPGPDQPRLYLVAHRPVGRDAPSGPIAGLVTEMATMRSATAGLGPDLAGNRLGGPGLSTTGGPAGANGYQEWPLGRLAETRSALAGRLVASAPPDVGPEQRRLEDERAWLHARGRHSDLIDKRAQALAAAAAARRRWLDQHAGELSEWVGVDAAMAVRGDLLTVGAEARPSRIVAAELGPLPLDERQRGPWRRAARTIECYRDRWAIADEPGSWRRPGPDTGIDPAQRNDLAHAVAAIRAVSQGHALCRGEPLSRGPPPFGCPPESSRPASGKVEGNRYAFAQVSCLWLPDTAP